MAALVQSFPQQQSSSPAMLQARPSSASGILQSTSANQQYQQPSRGIHRNSYHGISSSQGSNIYRGQTTGSPIQPYTFAGNLQTTGYRQQQPPHLRLDQRTTSAPAGMNNYAQHPQGQRVARYPAPASVSTTTSSSSSEMSAPNSTHGDGSDGTIMTAQLAIRPKSTIINGTPSLLGPGAPITTSKPAPERYRRTANRRAESSSSVPQVSSPTTPIQSGWNINLTSAQQQQQQAQFEQSLQFNRYSGLGGRPQALQSAYDNGNNQQRGAMDDSYLPKQGAQNNQNRRRSIHAIGGNFGENTVKQVSQGPHGQMLNQHPLRSSPVVRPMTSPEIVDKSETQSSRSRAASAPKRDSSLIAAGTNPSPRNAATATLTNAQQKQQVNIPPRGSSSFTDAIKRGSSPLSKPMAMSNKPAATKDAFASTVAAVLESPTKKAEAAPSQAASTLAALNDKAGKKPSRLRRAFSFGSAAELRKASGDTTGGAASERARLHKERIQDAHDAEQERIAKRQEEGGLGAGIYTAGQGNFFSGSTDNLSISSTASSASIMIRKMGKGMKKSTRSLVGLFRPKSVIGVPAADEPIQQAPSAEVSMVTVEAERQRVNVTAVPYDAGGGTGFPKLERNSIDAAAAFPVRPSAFPVRPSASTDNSVDSRKSIIGGDQDRAEILATMKRGILKRNGTDSSASSPVVSAVDTKAPSFGLPEIPHVNDSPASSAPGTPVGDSPGGHHRRTESVTLNGEDYFMSALRFSGGEGSKSVPAIPAAKRNISWKNTTNYHDTWASTEYDRRGEIATCNRLTPMLAQQIKEELNSFKMEMEVHENSKIYTHFF